MAAIGGPQPVPAMNFEFSTPQIGNQIFVCLDITDDTRMIAQRVTLPIGAAKQLAKGLESAASAASKQLVKPTSGLASA